MNNPTRVRSFPPHVVASDGKMLYPPPFIPLQTAEGEETDRFLEVPLRVGQQSIWFSRRMGHVSRWHNDYWGSQFANDHMIRNFDAGQGLGLNEQWIDFLATASERITNPTHTAASAMPRNDLLRIIWNRVDHWDARFRGGNQLTFTGTVTPFNFDSIGYAFPSRKANGSSETQLFMWRMRMTLTVDVNWQGIEGLNRQSAWCYFPEGWDGSIGGPCFNRYHMGPRFIDRMCGADTLGQWIDPETQVVTPMPNWETGSVPIISTNYTAHGSTTAAGLVELPPFEGGGTGPIPFTSGYAMHVCGSTDARSEKLGVGVYSRFHVGLGTDQLLTRCTSFGVNLNLVSAAAPSEDNYRGVAYNVGPLSIKGRQQGWIGNQLWWCSGESPDACAQMLLDVHRQRAADRHAFDVPPQVIAGMVDEAGTPYPFRDGPMNPGT